MRSFHLPAVRAKNYIRPHEALIATGAGIAIAATAKYLAAFLLILWLLAGGQ